MEWSRELEVTGIDILMSNYFGRVIVISYSPSSLEFKYNLSKTKEVIIQASEVSGLLTVSNCATGSMCP